MIPCPVQHAISERSGTLHGDAIGLERHRNHLATSVLTCIIQEEESHRWRGTLAIMNEVMQRTMRFILEQQGQLRVTLEPVWQGRALV